MQVREEEAAARMRIHELESEVEEARQQAAAVERMRIELKVCSI
jgi:hypothetical protein